MRTGLALFCVLVLGLFCLAPSIASAGCDGANPNASVCKIDEGSYRLFWNMTERIGCTGNVTSILRRCGTGSWVEIFHDPDDQGRYTDQVPNSCLSGWTYRWVYTVHCEGELPSVCMVDIVPEPCQ